MSGGSPCKLSLAKILCWYLCSSDVALLIKLTTTKSIAIYRHYIQRFLLIADSLERPRGGKMGRKKISIARISDERNR